MVVGLEITKHLQRVKPNLGNPLLGIDTKGKLVKKMSCMSSVAWYNHYVKVTENTLHFRLNEQSPSDCGKLPFLELGPSPGLVQRAVDAIRRLCYSNGFAAIVCFLIHLPAKHFKRSGLDLLRSAWFTLSRCKCKWTDFFLFLKLDFSQNSVVLCCNGYII